MKRSRLGAEQIVGILKETNAGVRAGDLRRNYAIGFRTCYRRGTKRGWMEAGDAARLKAVEGDNRKLTMIVAEQALDIWMLGGITSRQGDARRPTGRGASSSPARRERAMRARAERVPSFGVLQEAERDGGPGIREALRRRAKEPRRYGYRRPLGSLGILTPCEFAAQASAGFRSVLPLSRPLALEKPATQ